MRKAKATKPETSTNWGTRLMGNEIDKENTTTEPIKANTEQLETKKKASRKERIPLGTARQKLTADQRPGYVRRWVNDNGGRLQQAQDGGYELVRDDGLKIGDPGTSGNQDLGSAVSRIVGTKEDGSPLRAYLMEIEAETYQEDHETKQVQLDQLDEQIRSGNVVAPGQTKDGRYIPKEGISYR